MLQTREVVDFADEDAQVVFVLFFALFSTQGLDDRGPIILLVTYEIGRTETTRIQLRFDDPLPKPLGEFRRSLSGWHGAILSANEALF